MPHLPSHPLAGIILPETLTVDFQPYGTEQLGELDLFSYSTDYNGDLKEYHGVRGRVIEGSETSRLFQYYSTTSTEGRIRHVYGVTIDELTRGQAVRVAM